MSEETKKIELAEQELNQVASGMRKVGATVENDKDNNTETKSVLPVVRPIVGRPNAG